MANTALEHTTVSAGNRGVWTFSFWLKRSNTADDQAFYSEKGSSTDFFKLGFTSADKLEIQNKDAGSNNFVYITTRVFRDMSSWYHLVFAYDAAQSSASDRFRVWVNGVAETVWDSSTLPAQDNTDIAVSKGSSGTYNPRVGKYDASTYFNGYMAQVVKVDGQSLAASNFGSTDATTGEWKPKSDGEIRTAVTSGSNTWGTTGWMLTFQNSTYPGYDYKTSDRSSNLDFTLGGDGYQSQDSPSNIFATWNPLVYNPNPPIFEAGNTDIEGQNDGRYANAVSTLAFPKSGKFYAEFKKTTPTNNKEAVGIADTEKGIEAIRANTNICTSSYAGAAVIMKNGSYATYGSETAYFGGSDFGDGDIFQVAFDGGNGAIYFGKNGTWGNSSDPTSGSSKTGAVDLSSLDWYTAAKDLVFIFAEMDTNGYAHIQANFGNGYFGTTAISSEGTNTSGIGKFEYDVPTGYTALSTKGLNE